MESIRLRSLVAERSMKSMGHGELHGLRDLWVGGIMLDESVRQV